METTIIIIILLLSLLLFYVMVIIFAVLLYYLNSREGEAWTALEPWLLQCQWNIVYVLYQLSYQANWELVIMWVNDYWSAYRRRCTVEPRLSRPRLSGFLNYPDFFSGLNLVMNISVLVTIKILTDILFKTTALKGEVKCEGFLLSKSKSNARACRN